MNGSSVPLLLLAAGVVGFLHSILPDHWVPLAVIARTQRWTLARTARTSLLASIGHVLTSIILAGVIALVGLQFRHAFETEQGHIVGVVLIATGIGFFIWNLVGGGHHHHDHGHEHEEDDHDRPDFDAKSDSVTQVAGVAGRERHRTPQGIAAIIVPFGAAASPDLTVLPVALAASGVGVAAVAGVLFVFAAITLTTFVVLTVAATRAGYQVKGEWLEDHGMALTAGVLAVIGVAVFVGL